MCDCRLRFLKTGGGLGVNRILLIKLNCRGKGFPLDLIVFNK